MSYDKVKSDGTHIVAPKFTSRVLDSVPIVFQLFEWLLVVVAFQYADVRFHFFASGRLRVAGKTGAIAVTHNNSVNRTLTPLRGARAGYLGR